MVKVSEGPRGFPENAGTTLTAVRPVVRTSGWVEQHFCTRTLRLFYQGLEQKRVGGFFAEVQFDGQRESRPASAIQMAPAKRYR
jgi:hypothetical protein